MRNSKNSSIPEITSACNTTTGLRSTFKQQSLHNFDYGPKKSLLQLKSSKLQNRSQNITYQGMQTKLRKTNSQDRRSYQTINQSFDAGITRHSDKQLNKQRNRSHSNARNTIHDENARRQQEVQELRRENEELRLQIKEFQRLDEQHKDIQKLMKQQIDCQAKFYQREVSALQHQLEMQAANKPEQDLGLEALFQRETHHLASLLQTLPVQKSTFTKLLQTISLWLEQLFIKVAQHIPKKTVKIAKHPTQISENESQIDIGQLINFNEESDMLEWDSPQISHKRNQKQESLQPDLERFCTDRSESGQKVRRSFQQNKENIQFNC